MTRQRMVILLFLAGFLLRLILSIQNYRGDMNNYVSWGQDIAKHGTQGFYEREFMPQYHTANPNYPPLANYMFFGSLKLYEAAKDTTFWLNTHVSIFPSRLVYFFDNPYLLPAFFKIWAIAADIGLAWIVYLFAKRLSNKKSLMPLFAASLILFNPAFFYNSSYWGQIESIPLFFVLASFYFLLYSPQKILPGILFALSLLSKQTSVVFLPILTLVYIKKYSIRDFVLQFIAPAIILFIVFFFPFHMNMFDFAYPFTTYWSKILTVSGAEYASNHAFNFWYLITRGKQIYDTTPFIFGLSFKLIGQVITAALLLPLFYWFFKNSKKNEAILTTAFLVPFCVFLFLTRMHERHLEQALPFLLILGITNKQYRRVFYFLSAFHMLNLYHDWWSPSLPFIEPILSTFPVIAMITLITLSIFFLLHIEAIYRRKQV